MGFSSQLRIPPWFTRLCQYLLWELPENIYIAICIKASPCTIWFPELVNECKGISWNVFVASISWSMSDFTVRFPGVCVNNTPWILAIIFGKVAMKTLANNMGFPGSRMSRNLDQPILGCKFTA